jgi:translation initiation factor IF-1
MSKDDFIEMPGKIVEALPHGIFSVQIETGRRVLAYPSGKMRMHYSKIQLGDAVTVEISAYDPTRGRITHLATRKAA